MTRRPFFGLLLAAAGALIISPDTLMMRLSGLEGFAMQAWRGLLTALALLIAWVIFSGPARRADLRALATYGGVAAVLAQALNASVFSLSIATAPVSVVLFGVATAPVFSAIFARIILKEPTLRATWITIFAVLVGIGIAVFGGADGRPQFNISAVLGALGGLTVASCLALTFVIYRMRHDLSITLTVGVGSLLSGMVGLALAGPTLWSGTIWPIAIAGAVLLPASFVAFSYASRFTQASNVSLMLLLETVLGPVIVWWGVDEALNLPMKIGGAIVVISLAIYLVHTDRRRRRVV